MATHSNSESPVGDQVMNKPSRAQPRARALLQPLTTKLWKFRFEGFENLPESGPAILCPNHISFLDSVFTMIHAGRQISFVGKAEYMDSWKTKHLFPALGMIPIDRSGGSKSEGALMAAETVLRRGELFGIFPGHTGAARLAMKVGCPILPVGIIGTREIQPPDKVMPRLRLECTIKIGAPIEVSRYSDRADDHMVLREITDELMYEIQALTGQEYRNVYATKRAESIPTEQAVLNHG